MFFVVVSFSVKFVALNKYIIPPSPDYGNYLTQANILRGYDVTGVGLRYNPIFLAFLNVVRIFFDEFTALKVLASLVFSAVAVPFFLLAKKLSGNYLAALVSTWSFLFFEGYSEMIAWGGNPNFLGFSFLLLTMFFLVTSFRGTSKKNILLTGFSLSLIVGTHFLVAFFAILFFSFLAILTLVFDRSDSWKRIRILLSVSGVAAAFSLPYLPVYATLIRQPSTGFIAFSLLKEINPASVSLEWLFTGSYIIAGIMVGLGIFALSTRVKRDKDVVLVLCCLFVLPLILALITENPDRWFYFLPIPIMLSFALFLGTLFETLKDKKKEILVLALFFVLLVSIGGTILSVNRLEKAVDFYQTTGDNELQALEWIKEKTALNSTFATSGSSKDIGGGGNSYAWWIEGYSRRKCTPTGPLAMYSYSDQRNEVNIANQIFAGTYMFEYRDIQVSEAFPASLGNPEIGAMINGQYQNLLFLSDGEEEITFSPVEDEQIVWHEAPFYAVNKTEAVYHSETWANATFIYDWSRLRLTRAVLMNGTQSGVEIIFRLEPRNSTLKQFTVNVWGASHASLLGFDIRNSTIILDQKVQTNDLVKTKIEVLNTNAQLDRVKVFPSDPKYSMVLATYTLSPLDDNIFMHIRISAETDNAPTSNSEIYFFNSYQLIRDLKIDYIFLDKGRQLEYNRFLYDTEHYGKVFENDTIIIFRVTLGGE